MPDDDTPLDVETDSPSDALEPESEDDGDLGDAYLAPPALTDRYCS